MQASKVVVVDDFSWAQKYTHIMPTNIIASPYITQYAAGAPGGGGSPGAVYKA